MSSEFYASFTAPEARVLVVDDIVTNLRIASGLLLPYKMRIDTCQSGADAIKAVKAVEYDLIFMDHSMPQMDGAEATGHIRAMGDHDPFYKNVPIIAFTANTVSGAKETLLSSGFNDFISKPIDTFCLNAVLEEWIPKDKQITSKTDGSKKSAEGIRIEGIDTAKGLSMTGSSIPGYFGILSVYLEDGRKKLRELRDCINRKDITLFTVHIHALKSASGSVGADGIYEKAMALEAAGTLGDTGYIETHVQDFLEDLDVMLQAIDTALLSRNKKSGVADTDIAALKPDILGYKKALEELNAYAMNEYEKKLRDHTNAPNIGERLGRILQHQLMSEYDEAIELIDGLLGGEFG